MLIVGPVVGAILLLPPTAVAVVRSAPRQYKWIICWLNHLRMWLQDVAMMPKLKIAIGFFQTIAFTPDVYGLALPGWYHDWVRFLNVFQSASRLQPPLSFLKVSLIPLVCVQLIGQESPFPANA